MVRFIFACMAFVVLSLALTPIYFGIKGTKNTLESSQQLAQTQEEAPALSFEQIYDIADSGEFDPAALNAIAPAAGEQTLKEEDAFSHGFSTEPLSTLAE
jgi:hypothetical protein